MRSFVHLVALCAALLVAAVPVAIAAKPENSGKPETAPAPDTAGKPDQAGAPAEQLQADDPKTADRPEKDKRVPPGLAKKGKDRPELPVVPLPQPQPGPNPEHAAETAFAATVAASATRGTVKVKLPDSDEFVALPESGPLPVGASIDATEGSVEIGSETAAGGEQFAFVTGSVFRIEQPASAGGLTDLVLEGGDFDACAPTAKKAKKAVARAAASKRAARKRDVVRGLWASGKGKFRTRGTHAVASVRGTRWITVDRCHSTTVRVEEGVVDVADELSGKTVTLRAGDRHVASKLRRR